MNKRQLFLLIVCAILLPASSAVWANGVIRDSIGATSSGRGGTNLAHSDNGAILLNNPAGMVNVHGRGLYEFGFDTVITDLDYTDPQNDASTKVRPGILPEMSYIRVSDDGDWAFGFGVFAPAGYSATWDLTNPTLGRNGYKSFAALGKIIPGFAHRVTDRLSIGGTLGLAVNHLELETPFFLQTGVLAGAATSFDLQATGAAPTWSLGMQYQLSERTTIGAVYVGETRFGLDGKVLVDVSGVGESRFDVDVDVVWPRSAGIGFVHLLGVRQRISTDVLWYDWSHAYDRIDMRLSNSSNPTFTNLLGPSVTDSIPLKWNDSVSVRFGYEFFRTNCDVIRAGYIYNSQQLPSSTLTPLIPATLEHSFTVGYGTHWSDWRFDFAYQYAFGPDRTVGVNDVVGGDFDFSGVESQAHWIMLSFLKQF